MGATGTLRRDFAVWATAQKPKIRTVAPNTFAVPPELYTVVPESILIGALVDGQRYVSPDEDEDEDEDQEPAAVGEMAGFVGAFRA